MPASDNFDLPTAHERARQCLGQKRYPEAIAICRDILQRDPNFAPAYQTLGDTHQILGELDAAQQYYERGLSLDQHQPSVYLYLGNLFVKRQQWDRAADCYLEALQLDPNLTQAYNNLAGVWPYLNRPISIAEKLGKNLDSLPLELCLLLGDTWSDNGRTEAAIAVYERAIVADPKWASTHYKLGEFYSQNNRLESAVSAYQKAVEYGPDIFIYHIGLGKALAAQNRHEEAIAAYQKAIELNPEFSWAYDHLAGILARVGREEEAIAAYQKDVELNPNFYWSHFHLGDLLLKQERREEAIAAYREAIAIDPERPEAHQRIADILARENGSAEDALLSGNYEDAIAMYKNTIADRPDYSWGYYGLGLAWLKRRKWPEAADEFNRAIALNPDCFWSYNHLGYCLFKLGKIDDAIAAYREAIGIDGEIPEAHIRLGDARLKNSDIDGAIAAYLDAIRVKPDEQTAYLKLRHMRTYSFVQLKPEQIEAIADGYKRAISNQPDCPEPYINYGDLLTQINRKEEAISIYQEGMLQKTKSLRPDFFQNHWESASVKRPNFLILGTQKGGTTSLYEYLCHHPRVIPNLHKEVDFFIWQYYRGLDWYISHFPPLPKGGNFITGEASPSYMVDGRVCDRLWEAFPDVRLIFILRNPVDRAFSQYQDHVNWMGREHRSLEEAIADEIAIIETLDDLTLAEREFWMTQYGYLLRGMYVYFLEKWMRRFPAEQMLILKSEDFYAHPQKTLKQVFEFLGLPDHPLPEYHRYTAGSYSQIPDRLRQTLADFFRPHNQKLEEFLGRKFDWE